MTLTEQFARSEGMKQKAAAFDKMQREAELADVYQRGNGDAYTAGMRDGAAELNALMREGLAQQMADPRMYEAVPQEAMQPRFQGGVMPQDEVYDSGRAELPAPRQASAVGAPSLAAYLGGAE